MDAGLLNLAARRLAEMSETAAENEIARLQLDELASLMRYYSKKDRDAIAPGTAVVQVGIKREHPTRSPSLELVSTRRCKKQRGDAEAASKTAASSIMGAGLRRPSQVSSTSSSAAPIVDGQRNLPNATHPTGAGTPAAADRAESLLRIDASSVGVAKRRKLGIPGAIEKGNWCEVSFAHILWSPGANGIWSWVSHEKLPFRCTAGLQRLVLAHMVNDSTKRTRWARITRSPERHLNVPECLGCHVSNRYRKRRNAMTWAYSQNEENRACDRCTDARRPCLRLVKLDDPVEICIGWFPPPDRYLADVSPKSEQFWIPVDV